MIKLNFSRSSPSAPPLERITAFNVCWVSGAPVNIYTVTALVDPVRNISDPRIMLRFFIFMCLGYNIRLTPI